MLLDEFALAADSFVPEPELGIAVRQPVAYKVAEQSKRTYPADHSAVIDHKVVQFQREAPPPLRRRMHRHAIRSAAEFVAARHTVDVGLRRDNYALIWLRARDRFDHSPDEVTEIQLGILGPLDVRMDGCSLAVGGQRPRSVLALVAVSTKRFLATHPRVEPLWVSHVSARHQPAAVARRP